MWLARSIKRLRLWLARKVIGGEINALLPKPKINIVARVINPGDPEWVPAPHFVPPLDQGWIMPKDWTWDAENGWRRVVARRNSDGR